MRTNEQGSEVKLTGFGFSQRRARALITGTNRGFISYTVIHSKKRNEEGYNRVRFAVGDAV